jgi:hypothetical protein
MVCCFAVVERCKQRRDPRLPATAWKLFDYRRAKTWPLPVLQQLLIPVNHPKQLVFTARIAQGMPAVDPRTHANPGALLVCLQMHHTTNNKDRCLTGDIMDSWLRLWASELGYSFSKELGWDANAPVWVAEAQFFNLFTDAGYCFHSIIRHTDIHHMAGGLFVKEKLLFPIMVTPPSPT